MKQRAGISIIAVTVVCLLSVFTGCKTRPPRVPSLPSEGEERDMALGDITVSGMKFAPITNNTSDGNRLAFGKYKNEEELFNAVRTANMGISQLQYMATAMQAAAALAGTQVSTSVLQKSTGTLGANAGLNSGAVNPLTGEITAGGTLSRETSTQKTFKSPDVPKISTTLPAVPESFLSEFVKLMAASSVARTLDPATEAELVAQEKMHRVELEQYYNLDGFLDTATTSGGTPENNVWQPYRVQFRVAVRPGWYTFLKQYEAAVKIDFDACAAIDGCNTLDCTKSTACPTNDGYDMRVLRVAPAEAAQAIDEMLATYGQIAATSEASGGFKTAAFNAYLSNIQAAARRLEGFRKHTIHFVSYPDDHSVVIRMRPSMVANETNAQLQPTSVLFTAIVLVRKRGLSPTEQEESEIAKRLNEIEPRVSAVEKQFDDLKPRVARVEEQIDDLNKKGKISDRLNLRGLSADQAQGISPAPKAGTGGAGPQTPGVVPGEAQYGLLYGKQEARILYSSRFEPGLVLKECDPLGWFSLARTYYTAPKDRILSHNKEQILRSLIPPYELDNPFTFADAPSAPFGFYDVAKDGTATAYVALTINNPGSYDNGKTGEVPVSLFADDKPATSWNAGDGKDGSLGGSASICGVACFKGLPMPADAGKLRILLRAERPDDGQVIVKEVVLNRRDKVGGDSKPPNLVINIDTKGVEGKGLPLDKLTPEMLGAIMGNSIFLNTTTKCAPAKETPKSADKKDK